MKFLNSLQVEKTFWNMNLKLQRFFPSTLRFTMEVQRQSFTRFQEDSCSETFLKIHRKQQCQSIVLIKFQVYSLQFKWERLQHSYFTVIISKIFRTATFKMTTKRLLLENEHLLHIVFFQTLKFNLSVPLWQLYLNFIYTSLTTLQ